MSITAEKTVYFPWDRWCRPANPNWSV